MGASKPRRSRKAGRGALGPIGLYAAERRRELDLTQADLADLAGVSVRSVHALESGKETLRLDVLTSILDALGLDLVVVPRSIARRLSGEGHPGAVPVPADRRRAHPRRPSA